MIFWISQFLGILQLWKISEHYKVSKMTGKNFVFLLQFNFLSQAFFPNSFFICKDRAHSVL